MQRVHKEEYKADDGYVMTFRLDDIRWAYVFKKIAKSKGLPKVIREYVFENINGAKV